jgi:hypothetical protein
MTTKEGWTRGAERSCAALYKLIRLRTSPQLFEVSFLSGGEDDNDEALHGGQRCIRNVPRKMGTAIGQRPLEHL